MSDKVISREEHYCNACQTECGYDVWSCGCVQCKWCDTYYKMCPEEEAYIPPRLP